MNVDSCQHRIDSILALIVIRVNKFFLKLIWSLIPHLGVAPTRIDQHSIRVYATTLVMVRHCLGKEERGAD
jgi:hypothetical protein